MKTATYTVTAIATAM
jgi:putative glycosyltransferase (TIGR04372 family)